jgi:hypothetical protein
MKTIIRNLKKKVIKFVKAALVLITTGVGIFTIYFAICYNLGWLTETGFYGVCLATFFSEVLLIGWIAD